MLVRIKNVNDQPVLTSSAQQARVDTLTDYLPAESNNLGINVSYLLGPDDVSCPFFTIMVDHFHSHIYYAVRDLLPVYLLYPYPVQQGM